MPYGAYSRFAPPIQTEQKQSSPPFSLPIKDFLDCLVAWDRLELENWRNFLFLAQVTPFVLPRLNNGPLSWDVVHFHLFYPFRKFPPLWCHMPLIFWFRYCACQSRFPTGFQSLIVLLLHCIVASCWVTKFFSLIIGVGKGHRRRAPLNVGTTKLGTPYILEAQKTWTINYVFFPSHFIGIVNRSFLLLSRKGVR